MLLISTGARTEFGSVWLRVERVDDETGRVEALATFRLEGRTAARASTVDVWDMLLAVRSELESVTGAQPRL